MAKRGRPPKDDSRYYKFCLRLNDEELGCLNEICEMTGMSKSDVIRSIIEKLGGDRNESRWC